ncbi:MAG: GNAT family N-acetyltransferase [Haloarculaceae archaeon]
MTANGGGDGNENGTENETTTSNRNGDVGGTATTTPTIRRATPGDADAVRGVLDAAMLATDGLSRRIADGDALVAVAEGRVLGALVLDGVAVVAVAVRPKRRGQGIGTALVERALARRGRLVAAFDAAVRPFYETCGFDVEPVDEPGRYRGVRET